MPISSPIKNTLGSRSSSERKVSLQRLAIGNDSHGNRLSLHGRGAGRRAARAVRSPPAVAYACAKSWSGLGLGLLSANSMQSLTSTSTSASMARGFVGVEARRPSISLLPKRRERVEVVQALDLFLAAVRRRVDDRCARAAASWSLRGSTAAVLRAPAAALRSSLRGWRPRHCRRRVRRGSETPTPRL